MPTINQISDYIILQMNADGDSDLTTLKLQKLLYYTQAWHLAFFDKPLFDGKFQAWVHGPVNRDVYDIYKHRKFTYSPIVMDDVVDKEVESKLMPDDMLHVKNILDSYAKFSPSQLEFMTHQEDPWIQTRSGYLPYQRCENVIDEELMKSYYRKRLV